MWLLKWFVTQATQCTFTSEYVSHYSWSFLTTQKPVLWFIDQRRQSDRQRHESRFVSGPWLQHIPCRRLFEGDFSASRCLPAGYASLLRNTSVSHTSCGQAHRSVLSERARQWGWGWRWQTNRESRAALLCVQPCWSSDSLGMKPSQNRHLYPVSDPTRDFTERAIRSSTATLWTQASSPPAPSSFPHSSSHLNTETRWKFNENSVLLKPAAAAAWGRDRNVLFTYFSFHVQAVG